MIEYIEKAKALIEKIQFTQKENIEKAATLFVETIISDKIIHTFGTGHSFIVGMELFTRAGGLANVNSIMDDLVLSVSGAQRGAAIERISGLSEILWDKYLIQKGDLLVVISNSGRNAMPVEIALRAKQEKIRVVAITSLEQSQKYPSRHHSGKRLFEIADIVIDNCAPSGDGLMNINDQLTGPASSLSGVLIVNAIATEAMKICGQSGMECPVYQSQNVDGSDNGYLFTRFKDRIKHL